MTAGRPTKYTPEMMALINEYIAEAVPQNMKIPTVEGLCLKIGIFKDTIYKWRKRYPEIADALRQIKHLQKEHLTEIGIFGGKEINASIVSLFLKANHGMIETSRTDLTSGGKPMPILGGISDVPKNDSNKETSET